MNVAGQVGNEREQLGDAGMPDVPSRSTSQDRLLQVNVRGEEIVPGMRRWVPPARGERLDNLLPISISDTLSI